MKKLLILMFTLLTFTCFGTSIKVEKIIDGDTFETETGEKVRLIGINAPEIADIFGQEAKKHLIQLIEGKIVDLVADPLWFQCSLFQRSLKSTNENRGLCPEKYNENSIGAIKN